ncbi:MAG: NFACT RNA binding domain-containing protein [Nanoarchaeota archaeon]|nr:NFACT RNA binding domain-containing protein [Nanoarchaeota archaeon]
MNIELSLFKSLEENANEYYQKSKKLKKKIPGTLYAIERTKKEIEEFKQQYNAKEEIKKKEQLFSHVKSQWYHQFRYTILPSGLLAVWAQNAQLNELLIKKYATNNDLIFHTEAPGSPFGIIQQTTHKATREDIQTMALCIGAFSSAWSRGLGTTDVFYVHLDQVTKTAQSGEFIAKGAFMIRGEKQFVKNVVLELGVSQKTITHYNEEEEEEYHQRELILGIPHQLKQYGEEKILVLTPTVSEAKDLHKNIIKHFNLDRKFQLPKFIPQGAKINGVLKINNK